VQAFGNIDLWHTFSGGAAPSAPRRKPRRKPASRRVRFDESEVEPIEVTRRGKKEGLPEELGDMSEEAGKRFEKLPEQMERSERQHEIGEAGATTSHIVGGVVEQVGEGFFFQNTRAEIARLEHTALRRFLDTVAPKVEALRRRPR
jgi:hypothetical protein